MNVAFSRPYITIIKKTNILRSKKRMLLLLFSSMVPMVDSISYTVPISKSHTQSVVKVLPEDLAFYDNDTTFRESMDSSSGWLNLCKDWIISPNNIYYHITYGFFLIGFLAPTNFAGWIWLRAAAVVGSIVMFYWGWFHECDQDTVVWAILFFIVNLIYLTLALIKLRPVKFDKEIEAVSNTFLLYISFKAIAKLN